MQQRKWAIELASMAAIGVVLALMGPFGTFALPLGARLLCWQVFILGGYAVFRPVVAAGTLAAQHGGIPRWLAIGAACMLASMPVTLLVAWALSGMRWRGLTLDTLVGLYPDVVVVGAAITILQVVLGQVQGSTPARAVEQAAVPDKPADAAPASDLRSLAEPAPLPAQPAQPRLLARLPTGHAEDVIALESEDHYVRVHSRTGSTLLLLRLADAIAELDGQDGLRTHRSWWVARDAVEAVLQQDRAVRLRLVNGIEVPVARNAVAEVRAAGWL